MRGFFAYARIMGVVGVFCTGAWAQLPVMSVRLAGYTPNNYGTCRPQSGFGNGSALPCSVSTECNPGESCGQLFRDVSCSAIGTAGDAECLAATGGPSKCERIKIFPSEGPGTTALRCSAVASAPAGMVGPGDTLFLEVFADEWDQTPTVGLCTNGKNDCTIGEFEPCKSCRITNGGAGPRCADTSECTGPLQCMLDKHCSMTGDVCEQDPQCLASETCVADTCDDFPSIATYQWTIDSSQFSNAHGPQSRLIFGELPCTTGTILDACSHGYGAGCKPCSAATCDGGICSDQADVFLFEPRLDFIFNGLSPAVNCVAPTINDIRCGGTLQGGSAPVADDGTHKYQGTTVVTVSDGACGTFSVGLIDDPLRTFLRDGFALSIPGLVTNPVTLEIDARGDCGRCDDDGDLCTLDFCSCGGLCVHPPIVCAAPDVCNPSTGECGPPVGCELSGMTSTPSHCSIDPGIPHDISSTLPPLGWTVIDLAFGTANGCDTSELTTTDFSVAVTPALTPPDEIVVQSVSGTGSNATVILSGPIPARHWVCLTHDGLGAAGGPETTCLGALPADANATQESSAADIAAVIECLVSGTCEVWKCDIDRLDACTGADVEATVNLLNGADMFDVWDMVTLPVLAECPAP